MADLMASHRSPRPGRTPARRPHAVDERRPEQLLALHDAWQDDLGVLARQSPTLVFAVLGQARAVGRVDPGAESQVLSDVLTAWAVRSSLDVIERAALPAPVPGPASPSSPERKHHARQDRHPPDWTSTQITFRLRNLVATETYYFTVNDQAGRPLGSVGEPCHRRRGQGLGRRNASSTSCRPWRPEPPVPTSSASSRRMRSTRPSRRTPGRTRDPTCGTFQYIPVPPTPHRPPPPPQVVRLDRGAVDPDDRRGAVRPRADRHDCPFLRRVQGVRRRDRLPRRGSAATFGGDAYRRLRQGDRGVPGAVRGPDRRPGRCHLRLSDR